MLLRPGSPTPAAAIADLLHPDKCGIFCAEIDTMSGIQYVVDERGEQQAVIIDLKKYRALWEDFADRVLATRRATEPRETLADVRKQLLKSGKLHA